MRRLAYGFLLFSLIGFLLTSSIQAARASDLSYARIVRVSLVSGDVQVSLPGHPKWEAALQNMPVTQGVTVGTNDGVAEVQFEDGTTAWIDENTLVQFTELALADGGRITKLTLAQGTVSVYAAPKSADSFTVTAGKQTITVAKHSLFRADAFRDGVSVSVLQGQVQVSSGNAGMQILAKGKTLAYRDNAALAVVTSNPKADRWDRWVNQRESYGQAETAQALSYTNSPVTYGLGDLSAYGSWDYLPGYGYGWQPYGMGSCWMPFTNGQWGFYQGFGWTWISGEPWGWLPYHFGSWNFSPSYGWMWFPSSFDFWNPAPVNWYSTRNQVGWWPTTFSAPSQLMLDQFVGGCAGMGGAWLSPYYYERTRARTDQSRGKRPVPPRLLLTAKRLGDGGHIGLMAFEGVGEKVRPLQAEPLENGKLPKFGEFAGAPNRSDSPMASRTLAPTAADMAHLQKALLGAAGKIPTLNATIPSAPSRGSLQIANAMHMPAAIPHSPPRMSFQQWRGTDANSRSSGAGNPSLGFSMSRSQSVGSAASASSGSHASAPASSGHPR
ncbi:MAG: FecR family protein [Candidatus Acidiferrales bacterium]